MRLRHILMIACCAACLGCGQEASAPGVPAPGTMRVVSVSPVSSAEQARQLIPNGRFTDWWAGAPSPEGFSAPEASISSLEKIVLTDGAAVVRQTWRNADVDKEASQLFSVGVADLKASRQYTLSVEVAFSGGQGISMNLLQAGPDGKPIPLQAPFIKLGPSVGIVKRYIKTFNPSSDGKVIITANAGGPATVDWYRWELTEKEGRQ